MFWCAASKIMIYQLGKCENEVIKFRSQTLSILVTSIIGFSLDCTMIGKSLDMNTASKLEPTQKRTEGLALVWGSEFTTKAAEPHGDSKELLPSHCLVGFNPVVTRTRIYRAAPLKEKTYVVTGHVICDPFSAVRRLLSNVQYNVARLATKLRRVT
jgi:hypothetical protein